MLKYVMLAYTDWRFWGFVVKLYGQATKHREWWECYLFLVIPVNVFRSPGKIFSRAGEIDEAPGIDEKVWVAQHLHGWVW